MRSALLFDLQQMPYTEACAFQQELFRLRVQGSLPDTLILVEHAPVYTVGRAGGLEHLKVGIDDLARQGLFLCETDRGGSVTFHGWGQLVAYPVFHLDSFGGDLHRYVRLLEKVVIQVLGQYGIQGVRFPPHTGVWVGEEKIAAIGVACRSSVTTHGFALNVNTDLHYFSLINPCGITRYGVTSMARLLGEELPLEIIKSSVCDHLAALFQLNLLPSSPQMVFPPPGEEKVGGRSSAFSTLA